MVDEVIQQNVLDTFVSGLSDEVINRSEGDLLSQEMISQYVAQMMQQTEADLQRYLDFAANYEGDRSSLQAEVANIRTNLLTMYQGLQTALDNFTVSNDTRYNDLVADVATYLQILSDVKLDSSNITLDNGDLRYGAWTILSQARQWDLDIINRLNSLEINNAALVETSMDEVKDLIRSDEETISLVMAELSNSPIIQALDAKLNNNLAGVDTLFTRMNTEIAAQAQAIIDSAAQVKAEAMASISVLETTILEETDVRTQELSVLAGHINEGLALETQERLADIALLNDGLTAEINLLKDADTATLTALNNYKTSNDSALANIQQALNTNVTATTANASSITALDTRLTTNETNTASAISKADTALTENTAQASQISAINVALGSKADVTALNTLQAEVTTIDGKVTTNTNSLTSLSGRVTTVENDLTTKANASALNNYYTKTEADTATAGQLSSYDASLVIGGGNLQSGTKSGGFTAYVTGGTLTEEQGNFKTTTYRRTKSITGAQGIAANSNHRGVVLKAGQVYTVTAWVRGTAPLNYVYMMASGATGGNTVMAGGAPGYNDTTFVKATFKVTAPADRTTAYIMLSNNGAAVGTWFEIAEIMVQEGSKPTDWSESSLDIRKDITLNANAISGLDTRVTSAEGTLTSQGTSITNLQNSISTINGTLSSKADSSALSALDSRVTTAEGSITSQGNQITNIAASLTSSGDGIRQIAGQDYLTSWEFTGSTASAEKALIVDTSTASGYALRFGNNSGNDYSVIQTKALIPLDPNKLYRVRYRYRRVSGTGTVYLGLTGKNADKTRSITQANAELGMSDVGNSHYFVSASNSALGTWVSGEYYFKGKAVTSSTGSGTLASPRTFANKVAYIGLMGLLNYSGAAGEVDLDYLILEDAEAIGMSSANADAITATNATVTSIDGRVTTNANSITSLTSRMATAETDIDTAINNAATAQTTANTAVTNAQAAANSVSSLSASFESRMDSDSLVADYLTKDSSQWTSFAGYDLNSYFTTITDGKISNTVFRKPSNVGSCYNFGKVALPNTRKYKLSMWVRCDAASLGNCYFTVMWANPANPTFATSRYTGVMLSAIPKTMTWTKVERIWDLTAQDYTMLRFGFALGHSTAGGIWEMQGFKVEAVLNDADIDTTLVATKAALDSIQTTLANADSALSSRIDTLSATVDGKANASALSGYYTKSETDSAIAASTTSLTSSYTTAINNAITIPDTRATNEAPSWYWTNYPRKVVNEFKQGSAIGSPGGITGYGNLETLVPWTDSSGGAIQQVFTTGDSLNTYTRYSTSTTAWSAWKSDVKNLQSSLNSKADASVLTNYYTKAEADSAIAASNNALTTTVNGHTTTLNEHTTSINGVMGVKTVTIDNNGVLSGYGLISQLKDGVVTSGFGIDANQFYIGAPSGGKKPFIVTTTTTTINGVSYPAGTWIDTAFIANATIGGAKIQNASIDTAQITDGAITNAKIENLAVTGAKIANATIGTAQIANLAVTGAKIANATIGSAQIADAAITTAKIQDGQITNAKIGNAAITTAKIGDLQVDTLKIKDDAVTVSVAATGVGALSITTSGGKVRIEVGINGHFRRSSGDIVGFRVVRDASIVFTPWIAIAEVISETYVWAEYYKSHGFSLLTDTPPAGLHTYKIQFALVNPDTKQPLSGEIWRDVLSTNQNNWSGLTSAIFSIGLMEVKK